MFHTGIHYGCQKQCVIVWILLTTVIEFFCPGVVAFSCLECNAGYNSSTGCLYDESDSRPKECRENPQGCLTYHVKNVVSNVINSGGRTCIDQNFLDCFHSATGLDINEGSGSGRCLKTILEWKIVYQIKSCWKEKGSGYYFRTAGDGQEMSRKEGVFKQPHDLSLCICKWDLCNKIENWKPDEFKEEEAIEGGAQVGSAPRRPQISTTIWLFLVVGLIFTLYSQ